MYIAEHVYYYGYCHCALCSRYANPEQRKEESFEILGMAVCVEYRKIYVNGVKHQFGAYEKRNKIAPCEESEYSYEKEHCGQYKVIFCWNYHGFLFFACNEYCAHHAGEQQYAEHLEREHEVIFFCSHKCVSNLLHGDAFYTELVGDEFCVHNQI